MRDTKKELLQWIDVKEKLPDKPGYYLVCYLAENGKFYPDVYYTCGTSAGIFLGWDHRHFPVKNIHFWQPLPELPSNLT